MNSRILLVDDESLLTKILARVLQRAGFCVDTASSGAEALACMASCDAYGLVVTDLNMPGLRGVHLLRAVRAQDAGVPIVVLSGDDGLPPLVVAEGLARLHFLAKPATLSALLAIVRLALGGEGSPLDEEPHARVRYAAAR